MTPALRWYEQYYGTSEQYVKRLALGELAMPLISAASYLVEAIEDYINNQEAYH
jgi:hypothetical protein